MSALAVCVMAYDEADVLARCLESARGLGELHVSVDRQSTDGSDEVARQYTPNVYRHEGLPLEPLADDDPAATRARNSYARMRNEVLDEVCRHTSAPWLMWLDADEVVESGGEALLETLARLPTEVQACSVRMNLYAQGRLVAVMRNSKVIRRDVRFTRRRHEHIVVSGPIALYDGFRIGHHPEKRSRGAHDARKLQRAALEADWREFGDARAATYVADWWYVSGDRETALAWLERALALPAEKCPPLQRNMTAKFAGRVALELGRPSQARAHFFAALEADWTDAEAVYYLGHIAAACRQFAEARHWFQLALQYDPQPASVMMQSADASRALPYYGLACVARAEGKRREAYMYLDLAERAAASDYPQFAELREKLDRD